MNDGVPIIPSTVPTYPEPNLEEYIGHPLPHSLMGRSPFWQGKTLWDFTIPMKCNYFLKLPPDFAQYYRSRYGDTIVIVLLMYPSGCREVKLLPYDRYIRPYISPICQVLQMDRKNRIIIPAPFRAYLSKYEAYVDFTAIHLY